MSSSDRVLASRVKRIGTLLHRLSRVRDSSVEAELIAQLTLETEAVRKIRALLRGGAAQAFPLPGLTVDFAPVAAKARQTRTAARPRLASR